MHWLPELIEQFRRRHEGVGIDVQMGSVEEVYRWVKEGKVDMAFASRQENSTLDWTPLKPDPLLVILPRNFDTGGAASLDVRRLEGQEFLMPSLGFHLDIMRALNRCGVTPVIRDTQVSDTVIISMVEHGLGVTILSRLVLQGRSDDVLALPLDPPAVRELGIATRPRKDLRTIVRRFISFTVDTVDKL